MKKEQLKALVESHGQKYSEFLGINLSDGRDEEVFKWFLASMLFGAPITEIAATKTYWCFRKYLGYTGATAMPDPEVSAEVPSVVSKVCP